MILLAKRALSERVMSYRVTQKCLPVQSSRQERGPNLLGLSGDFDGRDEYQREILYILNLGSMDGTTV